MSAVRNLGLHFDFNLPLINQVNNLFGSPFYSIINFEEILLLLPSHLWILFVQTAILSRVYYVYFLSLGSPTYLLKQISRLQNAATRLALTLLSLCSVK